MRKILIVIPVEERHMEVYKDICKDAEFILKKPSDVTEEDAKSAEIIIGNVSPKLIGASENLKWIQLNSAGTDGYTAEGALHKDTILTNATGAYGLAISEHMLGGLLTMMKKFDRYEKNQENHVWKDEGSVTSIWNSDSLIVGSGDIGGEFAMRLHALGSRVVGIRRTVTEKPDYLDAQYTADQLFHCLPKADIVATALPGTKETYHFFNKEVFAAMKKGAFFVNVGRGTAVDQEALMDALNSGHLAGACIDVTDPEPLPKDHPLWDTKNLIITPHISGQFHLQETLERIIRISQRNLKAYLEGKELENIVDFETGYKKH